MAQTYAEALYELKSGFLIIGLTGYTGSGCTTAARLLMNKNKFELPEEPAPNYFRGSDSTSKQKYKKLRSAWKSQRWEDFIYIAVGPVIFSFVVRQALHSNYKNGVLGEVRSLALPFKDILSGLRYLDWKSSLTNTQRRALLTAFEKCKKLYPQIKARRSIGEFITMMQAWGDDIRRHGKVLPRQLPPSSDNITLIPEALRKIISAYRKCNGKSRFVIDAFRNPYEVEFFKRRYSEFYLVAISRDPAQRENSLEKISIDEKKRIHKAESGDYGILKTRENAHEWIVRQNISECIQKADMFIENVDDTSKIYPHLKFHLARLIALATKPGIIPPTDDERGMQIASTARLMSGCISRQVGAAVVGASGYILGVGWNDPPEGQTPCSLRTGHELVTEGDKETFSEYERSPAFIEHIKNTRNEEKPFCFRTELEAIEGKKRAEYTRALHAEENAFLQIAKNGGTSLVGSTLYTTASTCTLCAKKAYQLGIKRIVFVEEYPDHALKQTIRSGNKKIEFDRFEGIIGSAFFRLYSPMMPEKDLIELYSG